MSENKLESGELENRVPHYLGNGNVRVRVSRILNILRHYRLTQLARRAIDLGRSRLTGNRYRIPVSNSNVGTSLRCQDEFLKLARIKQQHSHFDVDETCRLLNEGQVKLLNQTGELNWHTNKHPLLWKFQLHYHEFLLPLATPGGVHQVVNVLDDWLDNNLVTERRCHDAAWHPYCISRRLPVWLSILSVLYEELPQDTRKRLLESAILQADFLAGNLEWDLRGNHLLENLRALALAGCFFKDGEGWLKIVREVLPRQLEEQVLPWGEHFERCPMYHCQVLSNLLETLVVCQTADPELADRIQPTAVKMVGFLESVVHPDGEIPLLGDSCFGEAPGVNSICDLIESVGFELDEQPDSKSPYWTHRDSEEFLIFDLGDACASSLPAHGHCDLLNVEASFGEHRLIVDSGLFNYQDDSMRAFCRSTLAHNVVAIDDQNQFDIWSKFRMGRRGKVVRTDKGTNSSLSWGFGIHNAYRHMGFPEIGRLVGAKGGEFWVCVDMIPGKAERHVSGFLHFLPTTKVLRLDERRFRLEIDEHVFDLSFFGVSEVQKTQGWYCPEFGIRHKNPVLEYVLDVSKQQFGGWLFWMGSQQEDNRPFASASGNMNQLQLNIVDPKGDTHEYEWKLNQ